MLPSQEFYEASVQNVDYNDNERTIMRKMGEYFPETKYCLVSLIEDEGVAACFTSP